MIWWLTLACLPNPEAVSLSGQVLSSQYAESGASGVRVESMDPTLSPFAETTTDDNGEFSVEVQASGVYHLHFSGDGIVTTAFAGIVGQSDIALSSGSVFVRTESEVAALRDMHENCPSASEPGGVIEGVVEFPLTSDVTGEAVIAESAVVRASLNDAADYTTCVLDDEGESVATEGQVGATGRFAIFGVEPGAVTIEFVQAIGDKTLTNYGFVLMPEDGIAPFHPATIDLPK